MSKFSSNEKQLGCYIFTLTLSSHGVMFWCEGCLHLTTSLKLWDGSNFPEFWNKKKKAKKSWSGGGIVLLITSIVHKLWIPKRSVVWILQIIVNYKLLMVHGLNLFLWGIWLSQGTYFKEKKNWPVGGLPSIALEWVAHLSIHLYFLASWAASWTGMQHTLKMVSPFSSYTA